MTFLKVGRAVIHGVAIMSLIMAAAVYSQTHFTFTSNTGNNMTVGIQASINPTVNGTAIATGDEIGVFDGSLCVGACVWTGSTTAITVWGACSNPAIVGATVGDTLKYRVWHVSTSQEIPAIVTYSSGGPTYSVNGIAVLASLVANTYAVTYNGNGSTGGAVPVDANNYQQGATVTVLGNTGSLVKTGYTFSGWNTAANGTGTSYAAAVTFTMGTANVTLYAQWTLIPTYTMTYSGNGSAGGTVPTDANSYQQGATVTVLGNTGSLVKTGYTFSGWNTAANGTGTSYAAAVTFTMGTANVTLYAQWTLIPTYTMTYSGNGSAGGAAPTDANSYQQGATVTVLGNTGSIREDRLYLCQVEHCRRRKRHELCATGNFPHGNGECHPLCAVEHNYLYTFISACHWNRRSGCRQRYHSQLRGHGAGDRAAISGDIFVVWRITAGTAALVDSTAQPAKLVLTSGDATLTAVYDVASAVLNRRNSLPTSFDFSYNARLSSIRIAVPRIAGYSSVLVRVGLFDAKGRLLSILVDREMQAGYYDLRLNEGKSAMPVWGICRMDAKGFSRTVKVTCAR